MNVAPIGELTADCRGENHIRAAAADDDDGGGNGKGGAGDDDYDDDDDAMRMVMSSKMRTVRMKIWC